MTLEASQQTRLHSISGELDQIEYDVDGDPIFIGTAPFAIADDVPKWFIWKITYTVILGEKCPILTEKSGTRNKWDDRDVDAIMGWRP